MKLTEEEDKLLKQLISEQKERSPRWAGALIMLVCFIAAAGCVYSSGQIRDLIDQEKIGPNTRYLVQSMGWMLLGLINVILGFSLFLFCRPSPSAALVLKLYERLQSAERTSTDPRGP